uniref:Uncharacterized protein n=1 Tax=Arundo donax TaxID=35708 RepID=A0A0A8YQW1_ARUDO
MKQREREEKMTKLPLFKYVGTMRE